MPSSLLTGDGTGQVYSGTIFSPLSPSGESESEGESPTIDNPRFGWRLGRDFQRMGRICSHLLRLAGRS